MKKYDVVKLIDKDILSDIKVGTVGIVLNCDSGSAEVMFLNLQNYGDYAIKKVGYESLKAVGVIGDNLQSEITELMKNKNLNRGSFKENTFQEYDMVKLINDKPKYLNKGVKKGAIGTIMSEYAIKDEWDIIFTDTTTGKDIADMCVNVNDIKKVE